MPSSPAESLVRRFARETNLGLAGRSATVTSTAERRPDAAALASLLSRLGAAVSEEPGPTTASGVIGFHLGDADQITLDGAPLRPRGDAAGRMDFAAAHMPVTAALGRELAAGAVAGLRIGIAMTLEPKTAVLALTLAAAGADVAVYSHPDETDPAVADALASRGIAVDADVALSGAEERAAALAFLERGFDVLMDDGSHLIRLAHESAPHLVQRWIGVTEETTSGLTPLRLMEAAGVLATPVIAVNDAATKTSFDNRYGTGQSCVFAIADVLEGAGVAVSDQPALVIGYGPVGRGVAAHLAALGATVAVAETDPLRALLARHDGFEVGAVAALAPGALVVSATGRPHTVTAPLLRVARAVAVAGGVPNEVALEGIQLTPVAPKLEATQDGTLVLDRGGCINITAAEGNPIEIMDLSFATQLAALRELITSRPGIGVHLIPDAQVAHVAAVAAAERGLTLEPAPTSQDSAHWTSARYS